MNDQVLVRAATPAERRTASIAGWLMWRRFSCHSGLHSSMSRSSMRPTSSLVRGTYGGPAGCSPRDLSDHRPNRDGVAMFSILRRYSEILALGYVASRIMESAVIAVGAISLLSIFTFGDDSRVRGPGDARSRRAHARRCPPLDHLVRAGVLRGRQWHPAADDVPHWPYVSGRGLPGVIGGPLPSLRRSRSCSTSTSRRRPCSSHSRGCVRALLRDIPDRQGVQAPINSRRAEQRAAATSP